MACAVKICGLTSPEAIDAAINAGADMIGFVFFPPSPRSLTIESAKTLTKLVPNTVKRVALTVDADDMLLEEISSQLRPDIMQLHGQETLGRVAAVRELCGLPVMKAVAISDADDLDLAHSYATVADQLMFDAKPPQNSDRPGGNALVFDWSLIANVDWSVPWILAGGLTSANVAEAILATQATAVDVSSGVENAKGVKDIRKIKDFIIKAKDPEF